MKKIKALLYCTKGKKQKDLLWSNNLKHFFLDGAYNRLIDNLPKYLLNGKIVAECEIEVEEIYYLSWMNEKLRERILKQSCLTDKQFSDYMGNKDTCYALHISNLKIFDTPKELDDFTTRTPVDYDSIICDSCTNFGFDCNKCRYSCDYQQVIKAPKNMMKVCEWDIEDKVLISIKPEDLCKILNGEKTILIKKKVLKEMLENASK